MRIVVLGASGVVGRALLPVLADRFDVLGVSRRSPHERLDVAWATADATDTESIGRVLRDEDVVVHLVHSLGAADFEAVDRRAADSVAAAALAGRARSVFLGGLGAADAPSQHLRSRAETAARLASGPVPVTTLRAAIVVGEECRVRDDPRARRPAAGDGLPRDLDAHSPIALDESPGTWPGVRTHRGAR